jgi:hypothetical protein
MKLGVPLGVVSAAALALVPSYLIERIAEDYYLASSPAFGFWSGNRIEFFIILLLVGAIAAGYIAVRPLPSSLGYIAGTIGLISTFYLFCRPRTCYSYGIDGLEPLRMAVFFCSLGIAGLAIGDFGRHRREPVGLANVAVGAGVFIGIGFMPVVYSLGGANLLSPYEPWPILVLLVSLSLAVSARTAGRVGVKLGVATGLTAGFVLLAVCVGMTWQYFAEITPLLIEMVLAIVVGAGIAAYLSSTRHRLRNASFTKPLLATVLLAFLLLVVFLPNAVAGVVPAAGGGFTFGPSVYAGGYMNEPAGHAEAVSVNVSFAGTTPSSIQKGNFLAAGIGVHAPGCCVDGIDYGYRFDAYLFHNGSETLVASSWEICDINAACGGHPWKLLRLLDERQVTGYAATSSLNLVIEWSGRSVDWLFGYGNSPLEEFASLNATRGENSNFNIGVLQGSSLLKQQSGSYFFQFGILSLFPIGHGGWSVTFSCPAYMSNSSWTCMPHASSIQGGQSFWKALWRWGESYSHVDASKVTGQSVTFGYGAATMGSFQEFW